MFHRSPFLVLLATVAVLGCDAGTALTDVSLRWPAEDDDAAARLDHFEVEVWPPTSSVCEGLVLWRRAVCGAACTAPPAPEGSPETTSALDRREDGGFEPLRLDAAGQGPWLLVFRGLDADGEGFLYGCRLVEAGSPAEVVLWRPFCDVLACAGQFHGACPVEIDCEAAGAEDPAELEPPVCRALAPLVWTWEQEGVACPPAEGVHYAPCVPARVRCEPGVTAPEVDGVCPSEEPTPCGASLEEDLDCDGRVPGPCGDCTPGEVVECELFHEGSSEICQGFATCTGEGRWGECSIDPALPETCDGTDEDCDGLADEVDPDALDDCNSDRPTFSPAADGCTSNSAGEARCSCGDGAACEDGLACCSGSCVDLMSDPESCGYCGWRCGTVGGIPTPWCCHGRCVPEGDPSCETDCTPEGSAMSIGSGSGEQCCEGLEPVGCDALGSGGVCQPCEGASYCARCGNGVCGPGENVCRCPEDCADSSCVGEGESYAVVPDAAGCCPGLVGVGCDEPASDGGCDVRCAGSSFCTRCGDGVCGPGENLCRCPDDCGSRPGCVGEGGAFVPGPSGLECCDGLTAVGCDEPDGSGACTSCEGSSYCTHCGDGVCGLAENRCRCPADCT